LHEAEMKERGEKRQAKKHTTLAEIKVTPWLPF
jgi:hypothetical protein